MSNDPQVPAAQSSSIRDEMIRRMEAHSSEQEAEWKEDEEFGVTYSDFDMDLMFHVEAACYTLAQYSEETLVALKDSGMSDDMIAAVIYCAEEDESQVRDIAHYYVATDKCTDSTIFNTVRTIFAVPDLSQLPKGSQQYDDVSRVVVAAERFRAERINKTVVQNNDEEEDDDDFVSLLMMDDLDGEDYDVIVMTPQLAKVICEFPNDADRIASYILNRNLIPSKVDAGHLAECLKAPALALEEGVL